MTSTSSFEESINNNNNNNLKKPPTQQEGKDGKTIRRLVSPSNNRPIYSARIATILFGLLIFTAIRYNNKLNPFHHHDSFSTTSDNDESIISDPFISHPKWLLNSSNWYMYLLTMIATKFMWYVSFVAQPSFLTVRLIWTITSTLLLIKKLYDFYQFGRLLYFCDFCYYANFCFTTALWNVPVSTKDRTTSSCNKTEYWIKQFPDYAKAVFCVINGPVGGGTFMLGTALTFHHLDAFSSFWLHVVPMWVTYGMRWHKYPLLLEKLYPDQYDSLDLWRKRDTFVSGIRWVYLPWITTHAIFLIVHPYTPLSNYETLFDWIMYGGKPTTRDDSFGLWTSKVLGYCVIHFILTAQGLLAAALAFKYQLIHFVWICCVLINCVYSGYAFYENSTIINPNDNINSGECLSPTQGLQRCGMAWLFAILPSYWYCRTYPEHSTIQKADIAKRRRQQQRIQAMNNENEDKSEQQKKTD